MTSRFVLLAAAALALSSCGIFRGDGDKAKTPTIGERLPVLSYEARVEADPALASLTVTLPAPEANAEWTQPGGNASKSLGHLVAGANLSRAWTASIGEGSTRRALLNATPVIAGGRVYTIDTGATVRAFDAASGRPVWTARIERGKEKSPIAFGGGVSVEGGRVFATSGYGVAAAFDAATGAQAWRVALGVPLRGAPTVSDGRVFVLTQDNQLYALRADNGQTDWDVTATVEQAGLLGAASPAVAQDTAVVGFSSGELIAMRVENGRSVWQDVLARTGRSTALAALADIDASPVIDRGRVFAVGHGGRMAALELATGQRVWEQNLSGISTPWVAGDFVFVVTLDGELACLTRGEGRVRWITQLPKFRDEEDKQGFIRWSGPVLASDRLMLTGSNGQLVAVSPFDGKIQTRVRLDGPASLPPVVANGTVFVLQDDGRLTAFR
jgi:outer membrane protein assembly factor BamB